MANGQTTTKPKVRRAEHELLDDAGNEVESEEQATGYRFSLIGSDEEPFEWFWKDATDAEKLMTSLFGVKTLATNEASGKRNNAKGIQYAPAEILAAVKSRFDLIRSGQWSADREGGVGATVDRDKLASAICEYLVSSGKKSQDDVDSGGTWDKVRTQLETNQEYFRNARNQPEVSANYAKLMGRTAVTADSLDVV
jgi:hypothetical protein